MEQKRALGRGLGSLIPGGKSQNSAKTGITELLTGDIITNPNQPRKLFAKDALNELAASIEEKGILQPIVVRPIGGGKYELVAGERRYRAAKQIRMETVPVVIREIKDDEVLELALIENIQRQDLNPIEEALAYKELLSRFQYTQDELAKRIGKDRSSIANTLRLLKLPDKIRDFVINNQITMGHARAILGIDDKQMQIEVAHKIVENHISVREAEALIKRLKESEQEQYLEEEQTEVVQTNSAEPMNHLEKKLKDCLRTLVKIKGNPKKGKITIKYSSEEDFKKITDRLLNL